MKRKEQKYEAQLKRLREAAEIGIVNINSGSFQIFDAPEQLRRHLGELARDVMGGYSSGLRPDPGRLETGSGSIA
ncbi:MAG: hypothetical protein OXT71_05105 [Acidobacteriota bacterium]|nr:hypothetical protein [Acidobacteriota bacterium]